MLREVTIRAPAGKGGVVDTVATGAGTFLTTRGGGAATGLEAGTLIVTGAVDTTRLCGAWRTTRGAVVVVVVATDRGKGSDTTRR